MVDLLSVISMSSHFNSDAQVFHFLASESEIPGDVLVGFQSNSACLIAPIAVRIWRCSQALEVFEHERPAMLTI